MDTAVFSALMPEAATADRGTIAKTLATLVPAKMLEFLAENRTRIHPLASTGERYAQASPALRRLGIDVDSWPGGGPAGLFVVEERTVYLRSRSAMTVVHETAGHALDCALGGGVYHSSLDLQWRRLYAKATGWVTPYASSGCDEAFAEAVRAMLNANDPASPWPKATPERLRRVDHDTYDYVCALLRPFMPPGEQLALLA